MRMEPFHQKHDFGPDPLLHATARSLSILILVLAAFTLLFNFGLRHGLAIGESAANSSLAPASHADASEKEAAEQERIRFLAQYARLKAEIDEQPEVAFPPELVSRLSNRVVGKVVNEERAAFETRTKAYRGQMAELERALRLARIELKFAQEKRDALEAHINTLRDALDIHDKLAAKGQAIAVERLNLAQRILDYGLLRTDADMLMARTRQDIADVEKSMAGLTGQYRGALLAEFNELRPAQARQDDRETADSGGTDAVIAKANQENLSHAHD
jgi:hypothetical protein